MTDLAAPGHANDLTAAFPSALDRITPITPITPIAPVEPRRIGTDDERASHVLDEIEALDAIWEQEWEASEGRIDGTDRIELDPLPHHSAAAYRARRMMDVVISLIVLLLAAPLMVTIAIAVRLTSDGPALFKQARPGMGGCEFKVLKFRSMTVGTDHEVLADAALRQQYEDNDFKLAADDPRITALGRFIRKTSLDELPQLINVLKGDMSLVGIRPLLPEQLGGRPEHDQRLYNMMRPGMTGLWQVEGRSNVGKDDRIALDRRYVQEWSVARDLQVLVRTPLALLRMSDAC